MNKKDLKDIGLALITPLPNKYRFEGVDYRRASKHLLMYGVPAYLLLTAAVVAAPAIEYRIWELKQKIKNRKK